MPRPGTLFFIKLNSLSVSCLLFFGADAIPYMIHNCTTLYLKTTKPLLEVQCLAYAHR